MLIGLLAVSLSACGFHLRGTSMEVPAQSLFVEGFQPGHPVRAGLQAALQRADRLAVAGPLGVELAGERWSRRVLVFDTEGRALEYALIYRLDYVLIRGEERIDERLELSRDYAFDPNQMLAKSDEEARLREILQRTAVTRLLQRLRFFTLESQP